MKIDFRALNGEGAVVTGTLEVADQRAAARQLRRQGLTPVVLSEPTQPMGARRAGRPPKTRDLLVVMHQLTTLLRAGVSLDEAVASLAESVQHPFMAVELAGVSAKIRRGERFSTALKESRLPLPAFMHHLAEAGEITGNLGGALADGVQQMEYEHRIANDVHNALIYPAILIFSGIAAVLLISTLVIPKFTKMLAKAKGEVPWLARAVLEGGQFMNDHIQWVIAGMAGGVAALIIALSRPAFRQRLADFALHLPLIGAWLLEADIGRWSAMLSTLLASKVELTRALSLAQAGVSGSRLRANLNQVTKAVRGGSSLADALRESRAITPTGLGMIRVGERSGEVAPMLRSLAELYIESGRDRMKRFLALLEPMAILLIAAFVGVVMTGIILAITSVNDIGM